MPDFLQNRITFKEALLLSLVVVSIYFPVLIYINVEPEAIIPALGYFVGPAIVEVFYKALFIVAAYRAIDWFDRRVVPRFFIGSQLPTIIASLPIAFLGTVISQMLFEFTLTVISTIGSMLGETISSVDISRETASMKRVNEGVMFLVFLSISFIIINKREAIKMKDVELKSQRLTNETTIAQFETLKNQLSPDVLFQSFKSLSSLIHMDPAMSVQLVDHLSKAYQYILEQKDNDLVPLVAELNFMDTYDFLIKMRFGEKVLFQNDILKDEALRFSIAPLALQMLVEDAIKRHQFHNGERLELKLSVEGEYIIIKSNSPGIQSQRLTTDSGGSLNNIKNRYSLLTSRKVEAVQEGKYLIILVPLLS